MRKMELGEGGRVMVGEVMFKYCVGRVLKSESQIGKAGGLCD